MSEDWRTLGKAMRDAQRAYNAERSHENGKRMMAAVDAFDKALSEPPATLAEIDGLVKEARNEANTARALLGKQSQTAARYDRLATALETLSARVVEAEAKLARHEAHEYEEAMYAAEAAWKEEKARVAQLEAALRRWQHYGCPDCGGDCSSANPPVGCCIMQETSAALSTEAKAQGGSHD